MWDAVMFVFEHPVLTLVIWFAICIGTTTLLLRRILG